MNCNKCNEFKIPLFRDEGNWHCYDCLSEKSKTRLNKENTIGVIKIKDLSNGKD